jgi:hypothetical protein
LSSLLDFLVELEVGISSVVQELFAGIPGHAEQCRQSIESLLSIPRSLTTTSNKKGLLFIRDISVFFKFMLNVRSNRVSSKYFEK